MGYWGRGGVLGRFFSLLHNHSQQAIKKLQTPCFAAMGGVQYRKLRYRAHIRLLPHTSHCFFFSSVTHHRRDILATSAVAIAWWKIKKISTIWATPISYQDFDTCFLKLAVTHCRLFKIINNICTCSCQATRRAAHTDSEWIAFLQRQLLPRHLLWPGQLLRDVCTGLSWGGRVWAVQNLSLWYKFLF